MSLLRAPTGLLLVLLYILLAVAESASLDEWRSRSIYQIITDRFARTDGSITHPCNVDEKKHCGGSWRGIIQQLDYIQGMGFTAIWISPIVKNINGSSASGDAYHGFWTQDITKLNPHFGLEEDLMALTKALHDRDMLLMIDVVINHFAYAGPGQETVYSTLVPFNDKKYFHPFCYITDFSNDTDSQQCWLGNDVVSLPDMNTELDVVKMTWQNWTQNIIQKYSIDGMRIDAAKHVAKPFWTQYQPPGIFTMGEVISGNALYACNYMSSALSSVLNYPMWFALNNSFVSTPPANLNTIRSAFQELSTSCPDTTLLGTFTENQDQPRLAYYTSSIPRLKSALAFALLSDGLPIIYYGAEQAFSGLSDPANREALWLSGYKTTSPLYQAISAINAARNFLKVGSSGGWSPYWTWKSKIVQVSDEMVAIRKGYDQSIVAVLTNRGDGPDLGPYVIEDTNFGDGEVIVDVLGCGILTTGLYGTFKTTIRNGEPQVWIKASMMANSTVCPQASKLSMNQAGASTGVASYLHVIVLITPIVLSYIIF